MTNTVVFPGLDKKTDFLYKIKVKEGWSTGKFNITVL